MSDKLKACPFCGSTHIQPAPLSDYEWYRCGDCDALSGRGGADGWNTRPLEDAANARAEAAEARVPELQQAASEFIGYIKAGNNAKAHLQMLFLEVLINEESKNGAKK